MENSGKILEKFWKIYGKIYAKKWEHSGKKKVGKFWKIKEK